MALPGDRGPTSTPLLRQSGGTCYGRVTVTTGAYELSGGNIQTSVHPSNSIYVGHESRSAPTYAEFRQSGGIVETGEIRLGFGLWQQTGGEVNVDTVRISYSDFSEGEWDLQGGRLTA